MSNNVDRLLRIMYRIDFDPFFGRQRFEYPDSFRKNRGNSEVASPFSLDISNQIRQNDYLVWIKRHYLKLYPTNYSEDEVDVIIAEQKRKIVKEYFPEKNHKPDRYNTIYLFPYYAKRMLTVFNKEVHVEFKELFYWQGLINKVDANVYLMAYITELGVINDENWVTWLNQEIILKHTNNRIYDTLVAGIAENHMHLGASGYSVELNWFKIVEMDFFADKEIKNNIRNSKFMVEMKMMSYGEEEIMLYIKKVKFLRIILTLNCIINEGDEYIGSECRFMDNNKLNYSEIWRVLGATDKFELELYKEEIKKVEFITRKYIAKKVKQIANKKPFISKTNEKIIIERLILFNGFDHFFKNHKKKEDYSSDFVELLNYYIGGMSQIKFNFLQDNIGIGFQRFKRYEDDKSIFLDGSDKLENIYTVFDKYYSEKNIKKLELRVVPWNANKMVKFIKNVDVINDTIYCNHLLKNMKYKAYLEQTINKMKTTCIHYGEQDWKIKGFDIKSSEFREYCIRTYASYVDEYCIQKLSRIKIGIIFHYIKESEDLSSYDNDQCAARNKVVRDQLRKSCLNVEAFFGRHKSLYSERYTKLVVGIDAANYELGCRPEVFATTFKSNVEKISANNSLFQTYHVGEEFNTLCNGLRAIDEAIEFLGFKHGDRLGHALALGTDIETYFSKKRSMIFSTYQEYLDDIVWMHDLIRNSREINPEVLSYLENQYNIYINNFYVQYNQCEKQGEAAKVSVPNLYTYNTSMYLREEQPESYLEKMEYVPTLKYEQKDVTSKRVREARENKDACKLYWQYHYDSHYKKVGANPIIKTIDDAYIKSVKMVQIILMRKIADLGISIEVNPTSNLKISIADKYRDLPFTKFNAHGLEKRAVNIPISINTDDSAIFQTNLNNEYSLVFSALKDIGYEEEDVYRYLEYLRKSSLEQSFIKA
ncbi:MAG: hypothetical protein ACRC6X_08630 [Culicoidibacterales bacterium]